VVLFFSITSGVAKGILEGFEFGFSNGYFLSANSRLTSAESCSLWAFIASGLQMLP
jgi:hypothetical protein